MRSKKEIKINELGLPKDRIKEQLKNWSDGEKNKKYIIQESALDKLFKDGNWGKNISPEVVYVKVSVLNDFYSTRIYDTSRVADIILNSKIDERLEKNDLALVNDLNDENKKKMEAESKSPRGIYSFVSKYCSHHRPEIYPIYDFYVSEMLCHWQRRDNFFTEYSFKSYRDFSSYLLINYENFQKVISNFQKSYLSEYTLRDVDIYLWLEGKELFLKTYK